MLEVLEEEAAEAKVAKARVKELEGELAEVKGRLEEAVESTGGGGNPAGTTSSGLEERCEALEEKCEDLREELDAMKMLYTSDVSALQEEVEELTKAAGGGGEGGEASGGDVEKELAEMKGELEKATARADRAEEDLANAVEEAEALRELTVQDMAVMEVEVEDSLLDHEPPMEKVEIDFFNGAPLGRSTAPHSQSHPHARRRRPRRRL